MFDPRGNTPPFMFINRIVTHDLISGKGREYPLTAPSPPLSPLFFIVLLEASERQGNGPLCSADIVQIRLWPYIMGLPARVMNSPVSGSAWVTLVYDNRLGLVLEVFQTWS